MIITKFIHVLLGITLLGSLTIFYIFINSAIRQHDNVALKYTTQFSLYMDLLIVLIFVVLFLTGTFLVYQKYFSFSIPWIRAAYFLLALTVICWMTSFIIRFNNYKKLCNNNFEQFQYKRLFHSCHWLIILFIIFIVHDAVTKSTLFNVL